MELKIHTILNTASKGIRGGMEGSGGGGAGGGERQIRRWQKKW